MKKFNECEIHEAKAYAAGGGQALHLHQIIVDWDRAPACFKREVEAGRDICHLFDQDADRLIATARNLGVRIIVIEKRGQPGQHIDLCGMPLARALASCAAKKKPVKDSFVTRIAGVSYHQANLAHVQAGDRCSLVLEPNNPYDKNAIKVVKDDKSALMLGYIPKDCSSVLSDAIKAGCKITVAIDGVGKPSGSDVTGVALRLEVEYPHG